MKFESKSSYRKFLLTLFLTFPLVASADKCPTPTSSIEPAVEVKVSQDPKTKLYTYEYTISNGESAKLPIDLFAIYQKNAPKSIGAPSDWEGEHIKDPNPEDSRVYWSPNPGRGPVRYPGMIQPNKTKTGFSIVSDRPPGPVKYVVDGKLEFVPTSTVTSAAIDEPTPNCPGFNFDEDAPAWDDKISGTTIGPSLTNIVPARIQIQGTLGTETLRRTDRNKPDSPKRVRVLIFGSDVLDVSKIDVASIRFGSGQAKVIASKILPADGNQNPKRLEVEFKPADLAIRCYLDRAVFLSGKTDGKDFMGAAEMKRIDCKDGFY